MFDFGKQVWVNRVAGTDRVVLTGNVPTNAVWDCDAVQAREIACSSYPSETAKRLGCERWDWYIDDVEYLGAWLGKHGWTVHANIA